MDLQIQYNYIFSKNIIKSSHTYTKAKHKHLLRILHFQKMF